MCDAYTPAVLAQEAEDACDDDITVLFRLIFLLVHLERVCIH